MRHEVYIDGVRYVPAEDVSGRAEIVSDAMEIAVPLIADFEGFRSTAYQDPAGVWTIGYGFTDGVKRGDTITRSEAEERLRATVDSFMGQVLHVVDVPLTANQLAALTSFVYNVGAAAFGNSTLLRKLNAGDYAGAAAEFQRWRFAGGRELRGLVARREKERAIFESLA